MNTQGIIDVTGRRGGRFE